MSSTEAPAENLHGLGKGTCPNLTVVAAMLNERGQLESWLENLSWVDHIVIVDHGSSDGSLEFMKNSLSVNVFLRQRVRV